ncbi:hypothetical protein [Laspinema olomoucense]|uniref:Uncharacterized protein n=1 Tax=Laspinema olomoucense D3b TaxID=2953688 RepID=A0ABT2NE26_9CYAN|nr:MULTISPECIES: hypothetical protein [unclassified Laspinema]MCT7975576.1 hypothetical protein [Laspinema sp. D3d]MCT7980963.1 hypothetical protein [Laspinema sp. D3b]MCT7991535.1 hypothetical protein [Laspinema sp. D3a]MCT7996895.1 hypothetical protein [Laspinema sp. D3c]
MKKIRTLVQRKSQKKYPQASTVEGQFESRPFPSPTEASPEQTPGVQGESEGKKRQGFNFAKIDIFPPEESETPGVHPTVQRQGGDRRESEEESIKPDAQATAQTRETVQLKEDEELQTHATAQTPEEELTINAAPATAIQRKGKGKDRHAQVDDRHSISDPYIDPTRWLETLKRERVSDLFRTPGGLDGHVQQIQIEINRLISDRNRRKLEGQTGAEVVQYTTALNTLRNSLIASAKAAEFDFAKFGVTFAPLASDLYLECDQGQVKVDGKPV